MQGKISDFGIPEIFQLVASQGKSGALTIRGDDRETVFLFSDGMIVDVQPDRHRARHALLGNMLVAAGYLTAEELRRILTLREKEGRKIGEILVEKGKISGEKLARYLYLQVKDSIYYSLRIKEGDYRFEVFAVRPPPWMAASMRADVLLMEGMQFLDEYPHLRGKFPPGRFQVTRKRGVKIDPMALPEEEREVWNVVDYSSDPYRVFRKACLTWYEGLRALWGLWDRGLVEISGVDDEGPDAEEAIRKTMSRKYAIGCLRAAIWALAAVMAGSWVYTVLLSPSVTRIFAGWADFYR
ncbi:MAG TPA: hypothetical protein DEH27_01855 [Deltaproteobacteria bacterium]|nr:hypothetical protein [Deltaproteobacteria bacterium]